MFFIVLRFNINKQGTEAHSEQKFDDEVQAMKRFYNILAGDIDSNNYVYELVQVIRSTDGSAIANQVFTYEESASAE
jgi:hypothetical protein